MTSPLLAGLIAAILAGMVVEGAVLLLLHARTGRGPAPRSLLPNLAAGAMLLLAMLAVVEAAGWPLTAACLFGALLAHAADLRSRWRDGGGTG